MKRFLSRNAPWMLLAVFCLVLGIFLSFRTKSFLSWKNMVNILEALDGLISVCLLTAIMIPFIGMNSVYIANVLNGVISILYLLGYSILKNRHFPKNMEVSRSTFILIH